MDGLIRIMNNMIVEREYAENAIKHFDFTQDGEMIYYFKGKIEVFNKYIRDIEITLERGSK